MAKFIFNYDGTKLINLAHIIMIRLEPPVLAQKDWTIVANLTYGTEILFKGTAEETHKAYTDFCHELVR